MGIQGLLPFMQSSSRKVNMSEFSGCTVAVDAYCWLHKGAFSCAEKLARGEQTDQYVTYCMKFVSMLLSHNIKPILVFDGCHLPAKAETEKVRRERRDLNRKKAIELLRMDRGEEARTLLRRCVDVTHDMAHAVIVECRNRNVDCIVAPYEADAQLAYFNITGIAHAVVTEDSDLMLFGCNKVIFKMDVLGQGILVEQDKLPLSMKVRPDFFTLDKFRNMCILSGCDYLASLPGIGLQKACKFIKQTAEDNIAKVLPKLGAYLNMPNLTVTLDYQHKFLQAVAMFKHQPVFDPRSRKILPLTPLPPDIENPLIPKHSQETFYQIALGNMDPITMKVVGNWDPDRRESGAVTVNSKGWNVRAKHTSIWSREYSEPKPMAPPKDPRNVKRVSTFGKASTLPMEKVSSKMPEMLGPEESIAIFKELCENSPPKKRPCLDKRSNRIEMEAGGSDLVMDEILDRKEDCDSKKSSQSGDGGSIESNVASLDELLGQREDEKRWKKSPFSISNQMAEDGKRKLRGLSMLSKINRTQLGPPGEIVTSRYFSSEPVQEEKKLIKKTNEPFDMNSVVRKIISSDATVPLSVADREESTSYNLNGGDVLSSSIKTLTPIKGSLYEITDVSVVNEISDKDAWGKSKRSLFNNESDNIRKSEILNAFEKSPKKNTFVVTKDNDQLNKCSNENDTMPTEMESDYLIENTPKKKNKKKSVQKIGSLFSKLYDDEKNESKFEQHVHDASNGLIDTKERVLIPSNDSESVGIANPNTLKTPSHEKVKKRESNTGTDSPKSVPTNPFKLDKTKSPSPTKSPFARCRQSDCDDRKYEVTHVEEPNPITSSHANEKENLNSASRLFKWSKPLCSNSVVTSSHFSLSNKANNSSDLAFNLISNTPPNSQGSDCQIPEEEAVSEKRSAALPILPSYLQPARKVGLARKKSTTPAKKKSAKSPAAKQSSLLTMFGFKAKEKLKS